VNADSTACYTMAKSKVPPDQQIYVEVEDDHKEWLNKFLDAFGAIDPVKGRSEGSRMGLVCDTVLPEYFELYYPGETQEKRDRMFDAVRKVRK
jgi:hypothetical protein